MPKQINIALIGRKFMGKAHSNAWRQVGYFFDLPVCPVLKALCARDTKARLQEDARRLGWQEVEPDWRRLIARPDIQVVDICTRNDLHAPMAIAAARAGKHVICEKPLARNLAEARQMLAAVQRAGVKHLCNFNYRQAPALQLAKQIISQGRIGEIYHFRAQYLQDWIVDPGFPMVWRLQRTKAGSGAHGDLNAHLIDLAHFLVGEIAQVCGEMKTFIKERPLQAGGEGAWGARARRGRMGRVTVDDAALFLARFANGALGSFEATRFAPGRKNFNHIEINGSKGSLSWNLERMNELEFFSRDDPPHLQGWRTILATEGVHPYMSAWWPPGHIIGYEHTFTHAIYSFLCALGTRKQPSPNFADGVRAQAVLEAVAASAKSGRWARVPR